MWCFVQNVSEALWSSIFGTSSIFHAFYQHATYTILFTNLMFGLTWYYKMSLVPSDFPCIGVVYTDYSKHFGSVNPSMNLRSFSRFFQDHNWETRIIMDLAAYPHSLKWIRKGNSLKEQLASFKMHTIYKPHKLEVANHTSLKLCEVWDFWEVITICYFSCNAWSVNFNSSLNVMVCKFWFTLDCKLKYHFCLQMNSYWWIIVNFLVKYTN
jgi:hypothetical protein